MAKKKRDRIAGQETKKGRDGITGKGTNNRCSLTSLCVEEHPEGQNEQVYKVSTPMLVKPKTLLN